MKILPFRLLLLSLMTLAMGVGAQTERHSFTNLNMSVPDGSLSGLSDSRTFASGIASLAALHVKLNFVGRYNGDLYAYLRHINDQTTNFCVLLNRVGRSATNAFGYSDTGLNVTLDSTAPSDIHLYRAITNLPQGSQLTGTWQPDGRNADPLVVQDTTSRTTSLSSFNGPNGSGEWTLFLADVDAGATNLLVSWELELVGSVYPTITWPKPADIVYGTPLSATQLNASAGSVAGTFSYSPSPGAILNAGSNQTLSVTFTPADSANYSPTSTNVSLTVLKTPLAITANSDSKTYGQNKLYGAGSTAFTSSGLTNSETIGSVTLTCAGGAASAAAGSYPITPSAATGGTFNANNYTITYNNGTLTITKSATTGVVNSSGNPALPGVQVAFAFAASAVAPGSGTPTGTVQFRIDGAVAGSAAMVSGTATFQTSTLAVGTHAITGEYAGDGNFTGTTNSLSPVQLINTPPVAGADTIYRYPTNGTKVEIATLLTNDFDADGDVVTFVGVSARSAQGGTVTNQGAWIVYTPPPGFTNVDSFTYTISDGRGAPITGTVTVQLMPENGPAMNLTIVDLGGGLYRLRFSGVPNRFCIIQYTTSLQPPNWLTLTSGTTDASGVFDYVDQPPGGVGSRYYRSLFP